MLEAGALFIVFTAGAGFLFTDKFIFYKYLLSREDGQRLYLRTIVFGFPFFIISIALTKLSFSLPALLNIEPVIFVSEEEKALYSSFLPIPLAWLTAVALNFFIKICGWEFSIFRRAMKLDDFDAILFESMTTFQPIAVTLENRKTYVGLVADGLEPPTGSNSYLTIIPLLSGYRRRRDLKFKISATYDCVLKLLEDSEDIATHDSDEIADKLKAYYLALPRNRIVNLHLFNDHLYTQVSGQY